MLFDKIRNVFNYKEKAVESKNQKENKICFLSNENNSYTLYFKDFSNNYVLVGDVNYPYSQNSLDREWIGMNKHNFMYYEEFKDVSQLFDRNKEIVQVLKGQVIDYEKEEYKEEPAETLPKGWIWRTYDDYSGSLISPTGNYYFCFDWQTREYQLTPEDYYERVMLYDLSGNKQTFNDFKRFAEEYTKEHLVDLKENKVETIQEKISEAKEKAKEQSLNSRGRDPLKIERDGTTL